MIRSNARVVMGLASRTYDFLATVMATPPVFPGFESQFDQTFLFFFFYFFPFLVISLSARESRVCECQCWDDDWLWLGRLFGRTQQPDLIIGSCTSAFPILLDTISYALDHSSTSTYRWCSTQHGVQTPPSCSLDRVNIGVTSCLPALETHGYPTLCTWLGVQHVSTATAACARPHARLCRLLDRMVALLCSPAGCCLVGQLRLGR